jgi:ABC-type Na+ efflux pump permease subunit
MCFLSVAEMELRAAARQPRIFRARWLTATAFFAGLVWLLWVMDGFRNRNAAPDVFQVLSVIAFLYCIFIGTATTADSLSAEKREGTLGLLFLTNLNSAEIIAGKLCSRALSAVYGLVAIFPMLALLLLMGGITFEHFWRTVLASVVCIRQFTAIAFATALALVVGAGLLGVAAWVDAVRGPKLWVDCLVSICPLYPVVAADGARVFGRNHYWLSLVLVAGMSVLWLAWVTWRLARNWQDRPKAASAFSRFKSKPAGPHFESAGRRALRRRLLDWNPFFWLAGRRRISSPVMMGLAVVLVGVTVSIAFPILDSRTSLGAASPLVALLFVWLWSGLAFHALVLYYAAMVASERLAEDKHTGALELVLSTPVSERTISRGLWLAYARRMFFPGVVAVFFHLFFVWLAAVALVMDPPSRLPEITPSQLLWHALFNLPVAGQRIEWEFTFMLRALLLALGLFGCAWLTLGWLGRWLGLKMKHPGFAPLTALAWLIIPPVLEFSLACYVADELNLQHLPARVFLPLLMWLAFGIGVLHCVLLSWWAGARLRQEFRAVVTERFQPATRRRWWRPGWQPVLRVAIRGAVFVAAVTFLVVGYFQFQNWRSRHEWAAFQTKLQQDGQSLDASALWPSAVPDEENFAQTPAFRNLLAKPNSESFLGSLPRLETGGLAALNVTLAWPARMPTRFDQVEQWMSPVPGAGAQPTRAEAAAALLAGLHREEPRLRALADAARMPCFSFETGRDMEVLLSRHRAELQLLEQLHHLFQMRACALLQSGRADEAAADVLTSFNFARLARQSPDILFSLREQAMLMGSLQPLWEGMAQRRWKESRLTAFQHELRRFDLLADHTNAIRRAVVAYTEVWRALPDSGSNQLAASHGGYDEAGWRMQPSGWWFDRCIELHQAGQKALARVDVAGFTSMRTGTGMS